MSKIKCDCGKTATWCLMSGMIYACDDCVPRGCSCLFPEDIDEQGRTLPCIKWWYDVEGWDKDE